MPNTTLGPYDKGELVTLEATFAGDPIDVADVQVDVRSPAGVLTHPDPDEGDDPNQFVADVVPDEPGDWWYKIYVENGPGEEGVFTVRVSQAAADPLANCFTTVERVRSEHNVQAGVKTERIQRHIGGYSRAIRDYTGREFLPLIPPLDEDGDDTADPVEREFMYDGGRYLSLEPYEAREITQVTLRQGSVSQLIAATDWEIGPPNRTDEGTILWLELPDWCASGIQLNAINVNPGISQSRPLRVVVTGRWGAGVVPEAVKEACDIAVANRLRNPEGLATRQLGEGFFVPHTPDAQGYSLPPDARWLLGPYRRPRARMRRPPMVTA